MDSREIEDLSRKSKDVILPLNAMEFLEMIRVKAIEWCTKDAGTVVFERDKNTTTYNEMKEK